MALDFATGVFTAITSGGPTQSVVISPAFRPKVVLFFWSGNTADGFAANYSGGFGAMVDKATDEEFATSWGGEDNVATTDCEKGLNLTKVIRKFNNAGLVMNGEADASSFNADGFTVSWFTLPTTAFKIRYVCLGGNEIEDVDITQFTGPAIGVTGNRSYTGVGFKGNFGIFIGAFETVIGDGADAAQCIGAAKSSTVRGVLAFADNVATTHANRAESHIDSGKCWNVYDPTAGGSPLINSSADFVSWDADGFTLNHTLATTGNLLFWVITLKGTFQSHVGQQARRTTLGTQDVTAPGFEPVGLMLFGGMPTANATETTQMHVCIGAGEITGAVTEGSVWTSSAAVIPTDDNMRTLDTKIYNQNTNPATAAAEAGLNLWLGNGYRLDWTTVDANARLFFHIALGNAAAGFGTVFTRPNPWLLGPPIQTQQFWRSFESWNVTSVGQLFTQSLAGVLSFVGALTKRTNKGLTGTLSFIGAINRFSRHVLNATLSFVGSLNKHTRRALAGVLSFVGSLVSSRLFSIVLDATLSFVGSLSKRTNKVTAGTLSFAGTLNKLTMRALAGTLSFAGAMVKQTRRAFTGGLSFVGAFNARTIFTRAFTATLSFVGAIAKQTNKVTAGTLSFAGNLNKLTSRALAGVLSFTGTLNKQTRRALAATLSFTGMIGRGFFVALTATLSFVSALTTVYIPFVGAALGNFIVSIRRRKRW